MTTITLIVVLGQFILWIILLLLDEECGKTISINLADPNYINKKYI